MKNHQFFIIGAGSIGQRHIKNLALLGIKDLIVFDKDKRKLSEVKKSFKIKIVHTLAAGLVEKPQACLICTPPASHISQAIQTAKQKCHLFIEKPLSNNLSSLKLLKSLIKKHHLILQVGCNLRFHPLLIKIKKLLLKKQLGKIYGARLEYGSYLPNWRPQQDYRKNYAASKIAGGGIILDDIHEIDYAVWLFGKIKKIYCQSKKISSLRIETEDSAEMILTTKKGFLINIHMDYLQRIPSRNLKIISEKAIIEADINKNYLQINKPGKTKKLEKKFDFNQTYITEIQDFIKCIKEKKLPKVNLEEGVYALKIAIAAKQSANLEKTIRI